VARLVKLFANTGAPPPFCKDPKHFAGPDRNA
jgi:hypothetical protein